MVGFQQLGISSAVHFHGWVSQACPGAPHQCITETFIIGKEGAARIGLLLGPGPDGGKKQPELFVQLPSQCPAVLSAIMKHTLAQESILEALGEPWWGVCCFSAPALERESRGQYMNRGVWPCTNKTLFIKIGKGPWVIVC